VSLRSGLGIEFEVEFEFVQGPASAGVCCSGVVDVDVDDERR
jgi:hypothetical protein